MMLVCDADTGEIFDSFSMVPMPSCCFTGFVSGSIDVDVVTKSPVHPKLCPMRYLHPTENGEWTSVTVASFGNLEITGFVKAREV